jgi:CheY-like chemotaxis protein
MRRILIVDDNAVMRSVMRTALMRAGYEVALAEDGARALAKVGADEPYDLIITDLKMPELDGPGFIHALRSTSCPSPILVISGRFRAQDLVRIASEDLGVQGSLEKPFTAERLVSKVAEIIC